MADMTNPYFDTDFPAFSENLKWQSENTYNNQQAWIDRLWSDYQLDKTMEYNSIGSQLSRARDAGVSPSAMLGGKIQSAVASPQGVNGARSSGSDMSNINQGVNNVLNSTAQFANQIRENRMVDSNIKVNEKQLIKIASDAGVNDANAESVRQSTQWIHMKSYSEIRRILAEEVKLYNDVYNNTRGKTQDIKESESNVELNNTKKENIEADTKNKGAEYENIVADTSVKNEEAKSLQIENEHKDELLSTQLSQEDLRLKELQDRRNLADLFELPLGTTEFEFNYALHKAGKLPDYYSNVLLPYHQASWKPVDYSVKKSTGSGIESIDYFFNFNPMRGLVNPVRDNLFDDLDVDDFYENLYKSLYESKVANDKYTEWYRKKMDKYNKRK